ncbi:MAG: DUF1934 domain-containing protein [Oscillospiraceae bacterium]|nr:DUF1934 domain-containing protein [Oscillospiraceae bacterium]
MKTEKKVTITLKSISRAGGLPDAVELITEGTLRSAEMSGQQGWEISYDDSSVTGFPGSVTTVSCFGETYASMRRDGNAESNLIMEHSKRHHCVYGTPYGSTTLGIYAKRIINRMTENGGELYFKYTIDVNSALVSENEVYLDVKPL